MQNKPRTPITWNGDPIVTECINPPIPYRHWDWQAMTKRDQDNYCGCGECPTPVHGLGASEMIAVADLIGMLYAGGY